MSRELNGAELVSFIKERQAKQVRNLKQQYGVTPTLVVLMRDDAPQVSEVYVRMKQRYADDVGIVCHVVRVSENELEKYIMMQNNDSNVHGIIVQLPLKNISQTQAICDKIDSKKDVDGLGEDAAFTSATAEAIDWLLAGYNIELSGRPIAVVGHGKLVGKPLAVLWRAQGRDVTVVDVDTPDAHRILQASDIIVSATGVPRRLVAEDVKQGAVVVDAGTATEGGVLVGDVDDSVRARDDITITPIKGGVGPLTVAVLFDHVIQAALAQALSAKQA
jgi:methylenetetrahydrofolate dehydrogenase (NADP+)/methenyltetrahydrofolate cyclohydrolase